MEWGGNENISVGTSFPSSWICIAEHYAMRKKENQRSTYMWFWLSLQKQKSFTLQLALAADMKKHLSLKHFLSNSSSLQGLNPRFLWSKTLEGNNPHASDALLHLWCIWPCVQISPPAWKTFRYLYCRKQFQHLSGNWYLPGWKETLGCHHSRHQLGCPRDTPRETEQVPDHPCPRILLQTKYKWTEKLELTKKGLFGWVFFKKELLPGIHRMLTWYL